LLITAAVCPKAAVAQRKQNAIAIVFIVASCGRGDAK